MGRDAFTQRFPTLGVGGLDAPQVELQVAVGGTSLGEGSVGTVGLSQFGGGPQGVEVDLLGDPTADVASDGAVERDTELEEDVLEAHQPQADRAPAGVGHTGLVGRVVVDVDDPIEEGHDLANDLAESLVVHASDTVGFDDELTEVNRTEVAHRRLGLRRDLEDFGAEVRQVHDPVAGVALGGGTGTGLVTLFVAGILEGHPAVACLGQRLHHALVELTVRNLLLEAAVGLGLLVDGAELLAEGVDELGDPLGIEETPLPILFDPLHEEVGDPVGEVDVVGAAGMVAGVVAQLEELVDVGVPAFEVDAGGALAAAALVDGGDRGVEGLEPRDDAVAEAVGADDQAVLGADAVPGDTDTAGELREAGDVGVALVDALEGVLGRVEQVAARHLRVGRARVEQGGRRREVGQRRHEVVELDGLVGIGGQAAGDSQEEVLRGLDDLAGLGVAEEVAVIDRAQAEELEVLVSLGVDGGVEFGGVGGDELEDVVADQAEGVAEGDRLREPGDILVADFFVDIGRQHAGGELGVVGLLDDEAGCGADRQLVELLGGGAVGEGGDRAGGDDHRVDAHQALGGTGDGVDDLVEIDGFERAVALLHAHGGGRFDRCAVVADCGQPVLRDRHECPLNFSPRSPSRSVEGSQHHLRPAPDR